MGATAGRLQGLGGDDLFFAAANGSTIDGGDGSDTVSYDRSNTAVAINLLDGLTSNGTSGDFLSSIENAIGSAYGDTIIAGTNNVLTGGGGSDTFDFTRGLGTQTVTDFTNGVDSITFTRSQFADFAAMMSSTSQAGSSAVIQVGDPMQTGSSQTVVLENVAMATLQSGSFNFV